MSPFRSNPLDDEILRVRIVLALMCVALLFLAANFWRIQVARGAQYADNQLQQSVRRERLPGMRGLIVDRNGEVLAGNRPSYCVALYLEELRQPGRRARTIDKVEATIRQLSEILQLPSTVTRETIQRHIHQKLPVPLMAWSDLDDESLARLAERGLDLPGVEIYTEPVRSYPWRTTACHILGYVSRVEQPDDLAEDERYHYYRPEMVGRDGIEKRMDEVLRGEAGGRVLQVDVSGFRRDDLAHREPRDGSDVQLAIDVRIQKAAEEALGGVPGAVVVIDPNNGEVLALASSPGYDPNRFQPRIRSADWKTMLEDPLKPLLNKAVQGGYPPGSTFKPVTALAALESGKSSSLETHECPGYFQLGRAVFGCWQRRGHGVVNLQEALEQSCNVYFFHYALESGPEYVSHMASALGLGRRTGIELVTESAGLVPDDAWKRRTQDDAWRDGDTCNLSIGQGALVVTPLQMAVVAATLANGGTVYRPRLIRGQRAPGTEAFTQGEPEVVNRMNWTPAHIAVVRRGMRDVVNGVNGTAKALRMPNVVVAGKTGTAEFGRKEDRKRHAWMLAFAPYDAPKVAIAMVVDEGVSGGETTAPRMRKLMDGIFRDQPSAGGSG